jgi:hypothetical protein
MVLSLQTTWYSNDDSHMILTRRSILKRDDSRFGDDCMIDRRMEIQS